MIARAGDGATSAAGRRRMRRPPATPARAALVGLFVGVLVGLLVGCLVACGGDRGRGGGGGEDVTPRSAPEPSAATDGPADSVLVFYATDRALFTPTLRWYLLRFTWPLGVLAVGWFVAGRFRRVLAAPYRWRARALRVVVAVVALGLGAQAAFESVRMQQRAARLAVLYGNDRHGAAPGDGLPLRLGTCRVSIPPTHVVGEVEQPSLWTGDWFEDPRRHMVVHDAREADEGRWFTDLREVVGASSKEDAFVFVHGYNVTWEEAVLRTAQIAYDLKFEGAAITYSWPSQGGYAQYPVDEAAVRWSTPHLERFLVALKERSGARRIHLVAHSMGNRALTEALQRMRSRARDGEGPAFSEVVLAAPDLDADTFREDIAPAILGAAERTTLYASAHDKALLVSAELHGAPRAGEAGDGIVVVPGLDTVDVSAVSGSHSYIGDNGRVLDDLAALLKWRLETPRRPGLVQRTMGSLRYWFLESVRAK